MPVPKLTIYDAISQAETGSFDDPWIRTTAKDTPGGSTAYGPVQITGTKARDYAKRKILSPEMIEYVNNVYGPMMDRFAEYGNEPEKEGYSPIYDYGGSGDLTDDEKTQYLKLADEMLAYDYVLSQGDDDAFIRAWRGTGDDERYNQVVRQVLGRLKSK